MENNTQSSNSIVSDTKFVMKQSFLGLYWGLIIFAPLFIVYIIAKFFPNTINLNDFGNQIKVIIFVAIYGLIAAIYSSIVTHYQFIERIIRLYTKNSFDDEKIDIIVKKIFLDSVKYKMSIFIKYYLIAFIICLILFAVGYYFVHQFVFGDQNNISTVLYGLGIIAVFTIIVWVYVRYYLSAKLRYIWFSYVNNYGKLNNLQETLDEMRSLNMVSQGKMFKQSVIAKIKNDTMADVAGTAAGSLIGGIKTSSVLGQEAQKIAGGYAKQVAYDTANYRTLMANYELYQSAYKEFFKRDYEINPILLNS